MKEDSECPENYEETLGMIKEFSEVLRHMEISKESVISGWI